ncbi:MAG: hypothetical protein K1X53_08580 [Candidatus Sumerlaeaceae bacterium]|nr:hypothetical protein [Candidatus Sumerlaeaceae bacterium]
MAELHSAPFADLVRRLYREPATQDSLFDLHKRGWFLPADGGPDLSVAFHGKRAGNPSGPASGPHTQMAQNLVLSYVAGSRIMELKTVQINDRLEIPRPCIDMANVGYNVEWSQELRIQESLREYVAGMMLVEMLRRGAHPQMPASLAGPAGEVIYDISLGYDLKGIQSAPIQAYLDGIRDASEVIEGLRAEIPAEYAAARAIDYPKCISNTLTLSTFHGCPADEIERICEFLLGDRDLNVIVKMNPPMLGKERLENLLHDVMGYTEIRVHDHAYESGIQFDEAAAMCRRLTSFAAARGKKFGCKFSNTLEVVNHKDFFPPGNEVMYLSGLPLHVITLTLAGVFREALGAELPVSFSAGIDQHNFADTVASGFVPVTTCTDLLKMGGYSRLPVYMKNLAEAMKSCGADTVDQFILRRFGHEAAAREKAAGNEALAVRWASLMNNATAAEAAQANPRYRADKNRTVPKRVDSKLVVFDCLTCDKCVPVCPNDANFTYPAPIVEFDYADIVVEPSGATRPGETRKFAITKKHQIANYADFCNECGNCDTFCPEYGGPYIEKPSFYGNLESWEEAAPRDGFVVGREADGAWIRGRIKGCVYELRHDAATETEVLSDGSVTAFFDPATHVPRNVSPNPGLEAAHTLDVGIYHTLRHLRAGVLDTSRVNQVNAAY